MWVPVVCVSELPTLFIFRISMLIILDNSSLTSLVSNVEQFSPVLLAQFSPVLLAQYLISRSTLLSSPVIDLKLVVSNELSLYINGCDVNVSTFFCIIPYNVVNAVRSLSWLLVSPACKMYPPVLLERMSALLL